MNLRGGWLLVQVFFALLLASSASAQSSDKPSPIHMMLAYGSELRPEKDVEANFQDHILTNYAVGFGYEQFVFIFENARFQEASGNSALWVQRTLQDYMLWGQYRALVWNRLVPFFGLGAGVYRETVETQLLGSSSTDETPNKFLSGISFGVGTELPVVWLSVEARILFGDELDRNPTLGGLARIGVQF